MSFKSNKNYPLLSNCKLDVENNTNGSTDKNFLSSHILSKQAIQKHQIEVNKYTFQYELNNTIDKMIKNNDLKDKERKKRIKEKQVKEQLELLKKIELEQKLKKEEEERLKKIEEEEKLLQQKAQEELERLRFQEEIHLKELQERELLAKKQKEEHLKNKKQQKWIENQLNALNRLLKEHEEKAVITFKDFAGITDNERDYKCIRLLYLCDWNMEKAITRYYNNNSDISSALDSAEAVLMNSPKP